MANEEKQGGAADAANATGAAAAASSQGAADAAGAAGQGKGEQPFMNKQEFVDLARDHREFKRDVSTKLDALLATLTGGKPGKPQSGGEGSGEGGEQKAATGADAPVTRRELAYERAKEGLGLTDKQQALLDRAYKAENPNDPKAFVTSFLEDAGWKKADAGAQQQQQQRKPVAGTVGAAGAGGDGAVVDDPRMIDPATWKSFSAERRREIFEAWKKKEGHTQRPVNKPLPRV